MFGMNDSQMRIFTAVIIRLKRVSPSRSYAITSSMERQSKILATSSSLLVQEQHSIWNL
jgi:hypothetical protein